MQSPDSLSESSPNTKPNEQMAVPGTIRVSLEQELLVCLVCSDADSSYISAVSVRTRATRKEGMRRMLQVFGRVQDIGTGH